MDVESVADELYGLRPAEFTALRDRRAAEARTSGDRELADRIRALRRPTLAAWASNLLVRARPDEARALVALGDGLRQAHRDLDGARLRELGRQQHVLVAALAREAQRLTAEAGEKIGEAARAQVEATLHAALADPDAAEEWVAGRLGKALSAPVGFAAAGLGGESGARHLSVVPPPSGGAREAPSTGKTGGARARLSLVGHRGGGSAKAPDGGGTASSDAAEARRARQEREAERREAARREREEREAERRRAEEEAAAARREAAAREDAARHAADALEGAEQRAHEADLRVTELAALLKEAQARREAAHGAVREARERVRETERAAREAARHAREAAQRLARGTPRRGG
ncbi:hypothetical protein [Streptomyces sp. enrichment culture]|uniref:hypothetical protein n=1 Tax=Streptomyces sp. enrichment culture TaxID=1795815 RepID=UPI003F54B217